MKKLIFKIGNLDECDHCKCIFRDLHIYSIIPYIRKKVKEICQFEYIYFPSDICPFGFFKFDLGVWYMVAPAGLVRPMVKPGSRGDHW